MSKPREILFRGKRLSDGKWLEGSLVSYADGGKAILPSRSECFAPQGNTVFCAVECYDVEPQTVGQYTGLRDRNGKRIFEGDILLTSNSNCRIWYVDYKLTCFCANQGNANYSCCLEEFERSTELEVIGNVHDNPKLLEVTGDGI